MISFIVFIEIPFIFCQNQNKANDPIVHRLNPTGSIDSFANLPNGYLASASYDDLIQIWNVEEGFLVRTLKSPTGSHIHKLNVLHSGFLVSAGWNPHLMIEIWNPNDGLLQKSIQVSDKDFDEIYFLAVLKDGMLAILMVDDMAILNPYTEEILNRWPIQGSNMLSLAVIDFDLLATITKIKNDMYIWNIETGKIVSNFSTFNYNPQLPYNWGKIDAIIALPNGFLVSNNPIKIWDPYKGTLIKTFQEDQRSISLAVLKNGLLASSGNDGWIKIWNVETGLQLRSFFEKNTKRLLTVASNGFLVSYLSFKQEIIIMDYDKFDYSNQETRFISNLGKYKILILFEFESKLIFYN